MEIGKCNTKSVFICMDERYQYTRDYKWSIEKNYVRDSIVFYYDMYDIGMYVCFVFALYFVSSFRKMEKGFTFGEWKNDHQISLISTFPQSISIFHSFFPLSPYMLRINRDLSREKSTLNLVQIWPNKCVYLFIFRLFVHH